MALSSRECQHRCEELQADDSEDEDYWRIFGDSAEEEFLETMLLEDEKTQNPEGLHRAPLPSPSSSALCAATNEGPCRMTVGAMLQERYGEISNEMKNMKSDATGYKKDESDDISNAMKSHAAPEHKADRESMSKPDYLHAVNPLLCPVPDKDGRYRGRRISRWPA